jgi:hypothetical protein
MEPSSPLRTCIGPEVTSAGSRGLKARPRGRAGVRRGNFTESSHGDPCHGEPCNGEAGPEGGCRFGFANGGHRSPFRLPIRFAGLLWRCRTGEAGLLQRLRTGILSLSDMNPHPPVENAAWLFEKPSSLDSGLYLLLGLLLVRRPSLPVRRARRALRSQPSAGRPCLCRPWPR